MPRNQVIASSTLDGKTNWLLNDQKMCLFSDDRKVEYDLKESTHFFNEPPFETDKTRPMFHLAYLDQGIDGNEKLIAFTYDDGPHGENTSAPIDLFASYNGKATFFTVGSRVGSYPDIVKQILDSKSNCKSYIFTSKLK
ncbi:polysaccharide deacetylase family protein [Erysipelothrix sp. D19-032]